VAQLQPQTSSWLEGWQGQALRGIQLGRITAATSTIAGRLNGRFNLSWFGCDYTRKHTGNGSGSLQVADGTVTATNVTLRDGRWQGLC